MKGRMVARASVLTVVVLLAACLGSASWTFLGAAGPGAGGARSQHRLRGVVQGAATTSSAKAQRPSALSFVAGSTSLALAAAASAGRALRGHSLSKIVRLAKPKGARPRGRDPRFQQKEEIRMIVPEELNKEDITPELARQLLKRGLETPDMKEQRVKKKIRWLRSLKPKMRPMGPKPWDRPLFTSVNIEVSVDPNQASNTKILNQLTEELRLITGQHPEVRRARANNAMKNIRQGMRTGVGTRLRGKRMHDFIRRLNMLVLPRIRDFEGLNPTAFDKAANFAMKIPTQEPFRELDQILDNRELTHGFTVYINNNQVTQPRALNFMKDYGFPFRQKILKKPLYTAKEMQKRK